MLNYILTHTKSQHNNITIDVAYRVVSGKLLAFSLSVI